MEKSTYNGLGIFIIIIISIVLVSNLDFIREKHFSIDAKWFEFNPNEIRVNKGDFVTIKINNIDVSHGITIPEFEASGNELVSFIASKKGEFIFYCNNFCGVGHKDMTGRIVVE